MIAKNTIIRTIITMVLAASLIACGSDKKTRAPADLTPDVFSFAKVSNAGLDAYVNSETITVGGINQPTSIEVSKGEYSIDGGPFTSADGTVSNGQTVTVRHRTPALNDVVTETTLKIGGVTADFVSRTGRYEGQLAIVPAGSDLLLLGVDSAGNMVERSRASLTPELADYSTNHVIFSITKHPAMDVVFVTSMNECGASPLDTDGCWGNARVDRFAYDSNTLVYDGLAYLAQAPLRLSTPTYNSDTLTLTTKLRNQGERALDITSVELFNLTMGSTYTTTCDNVTLSAGAECQIQVVAGAGQEASADIEVTVGGLTYESTIENMGGDAYLVYGLYPDRILENVPECASDYGEPYQVGYCALTAMAFSADGSRAYIVEQHRITLVMAVDESGKMSFIHENGSLQLHGIAVNTANTVMYNGSHTFTIDNDVLKRSSTGEGGNATEVVKNANGDELLVTTLDNRDLAIFDLADPAAPTEITRVKPATSYSSFQHHSDDLATFVTIDLNEITAFNFDGSTLVEVASLPVEFDADFADIHAECSTCSLYAYLRAVQVDASGSLAVGSVFVNAYDESSLEKAPYLGATVSFKVDKAANTITELSRLPLHGQARAILFVETP